jgi:hypothetical protein
VPVKTVLTTITPCVKYAGKKPSKSAFPKGKRDSFAPAIPNYSSDPAGYMAAVNVAEKAKKDAVAATISMGGTAAEAEATKQAIDAINNEMGLNLTDAMQS